MAPVDSVLLGGGFTAGEQLPRSGCLGGVTARGCGTPALKNAFFAQSVLYPLQNGGGPSSKGPLCPGNTCSADETAGADAGTGLLVTVGTSF